MNTTNEYYISIDIEADGPCPGRNSMLQFAAVFYDRDGNELDSYVANIEEIEGGVQNPDTMEWWAKQEKKFPGIWSRLMQNRKSPLVAMTEFEQKVNILSGKLGQMPICVAYPAGYDFSWLYWYLLTYREDSCVGFSCLDMKTMAMTLLQMGYLKSTKNRFPNRWFDRSLPHTHDALDDAREQAYIFFQMKKDMEKCWSTINEDILRRKCGD